jgi:hypothetical protein
MAGILAGHIIVYYPNITRSGKEETRQRGLHLRKALD